MVRSKTMPETLGETLVPKVKSEDDVEAPTQEAAGESEKLSFSCLLTLRIDELALVCTIEAQEQ